MNSLHDGQPIMITPQGLGQDHRMPGAAEREDPIDSASARGAFGWTVIDGVNIPYLIRDDTMYVAVRMVEVKLLSKYPSTYPEELQNKPPLMSHYVTNKEAKLLNEINTEHCAYEYGRQTFNSRDLIVKLEDFIEFYNIVKKNFPESATKLAKPKPPPVEGGWVQVNYTVVPYILRANSRFVPLSVIRNSAGLLSEVVVDYQPVTPEECKYLNDICKKAGLTFTFPASVKVIPLETVTLKSDVPVHIEDLPKDDPFGHAEVKLLQEEELMLGQGYGMNNVRPHHPGMHQSSMLGLPITTASSSPYWSPMYPKPHQYVRPPYLSDGSLLKGNQMPRLDIMNKGAKNPMTEGRLGRSPSENNWGSNGMGPHIPQVGPPGWHPTMGSPQEYQRMLQMLGRQSHSPGVAAPPPPVQVSPVPPTRPPMVRLPSLPQVSVLLIDMV